MMKVTIKIDLHGMVLPSGRRHKLRITRMHYRELYDLLARPVGDYEILVNGREVEEDSIELNEKTLWMRFDFAF